MAQYIEFITNHPFLFAALVVVLGLIIRTEYNRFFSGIKQLSPNELTLLQNREDVVLLDIREDKEYALGHLLHSKNIPLSILGKRVDDVSKNKSKAIVIVCETGARSGKAAGILKKAGFNGLSSLAGGIANWEKANLPMTTK
ncbi:MAG: rhodanese-like domain-containing protein [Gammaproteobacteria bacterium]|nr:rhodanese-like domain-containing protein [Gammaproteobacteria bacterium]